LFTHQINSLRQICLDRGVVLTLNGLDTLALSIQNTYPVIAETYLDLPLDTGQLLSVNDFIDRYGKHNLTTSIDNEILFQEEVIASAKFILKSENFLLISGCASVGRTLLAVNVAKEMQRENVNLKVICLYDKGADLIRDITAYFSEPGDYLVFVDDANRLDTRLDYLLHYLLEGKGNRRFCIIATVRDYARESVIKKVKQYTEVHETAIKPLSGDQVKGLVERLFGIVNRGYQKRSARHFR
jgi:Holliday junction resolvasome RuvABC ATP-dependent DNA helicase subunit